MNWDAIVKKVTPYVVKIETQHGHGTGFLCLYNENQSLCGIATALHVVQHADSWQQPIRVTHQASGKSAFLREENRIIIPGVGGADSAVLLIDPRSLDFPKQLIGLFPTDNSLAIGSEVGWLGYPAIGGNTLCFFSGIVSASIEGDHAYLIDGVAINGVSGGPVIFHTGSEVQFVGAISAYVANRATGETLPGLSIAQDVSHFHDVATRMRSLDDFHRQQAEQQQFGSASPTPGSVFP